MDTVPDDTLDLRTRKHVRCGKYFHGILLAVYQTDDLMAAKAKGDEWARGGFDVRLRAGSHLPERLNEDVE